MNELTGKAGRWASDWLVRSAPYWFLLAAVSQLVYLTGWPMSLFGVAVSGGWAIGVALVRLGVYFGIGCGLREREGVAWAAAIIEFGRTGIAFLVAIWARDWLTGSPLYPAWWLQGLLTALLPVLVLMNAGLAAGWRPGAGMELIVRTVASLTAATHVIAANALSGRADDFVVAPEERAGAVWRALPLLTVVWVAEMVAVGGSLLLR